MPISDDGTEYIFPPNRRLQACDADGEPIYVGDSHQSYEESIRFHIELEPNEPIVWAGCSADGKEYPAANLFDLIANCFHDNAFEKPTIDAWRKLAERIEAEIAENVNADE